MNRLGKNKKGLYIRPIALLLVILQTIGRFTYKTIFKLIYSLGLTTLQSIKLLLKFTQKTYHYFNSLKINLPQIKLSFPKLSSIPKLPTLPKLPQIKLPRPHLTPVLIIILSLFSTLFITFYWFILKDLPKPTDLINRPPTLSTQIYDRHGQLLFTFYKDQNRSLIALDQIPEHFKLATLAIEDSQFYNHQGFSLKGIIRSLKQIILNQELQGGSTITQQLVKNSLLTPEQTLQRKIKELILSLQVEILFDKDEILQMYFNEVAYGGTAYGAEQAAQTYFGKSIKNVNLAEAALLAGLPKSPTIYSPFGSQPQLSIYRQHQVLNRMVEEQFLAPMEAELVKQQKIKLAPQYTNIKAPHFVMYVKDLLVEKYGLPMVEQGGLKVTTSLDFNFQQKTQTIVTQEINQLFPYAITNGAALVTNPQTGEILAMVGSRDFFDTQRDGQVNLTTSLRQPGSSIKPVNYAVALNQGFTAASIIHDSPVTYSIPGSKPYSPINYDRSFHGSVTLRSALANSYNVPAVKVLASYGVNQMIDMGQKMGITTWTEPQRYGLSLTLGGAEVKMTDMAVVYATLANQGLKVDLHPILSITDSQGKTLLDFTCQQSVNIDLPQPRSQAQAAAQHLSCNPQPVLDPYTAFILTHILSDSIARAPAFGTSSLLNIPGHQVAVKTGTTNDKRDNWTIGYTTDYLVAVWVGNNDNSPMSQVASGVTGASPIWHDIMVEILKDQPPHQFTPPKDLKPTAICSLTGQLACQGCPAIEEYFIPGTEPQIACKPSYIQQIIKDQAEKSSPRDQILSGASTD